ncbi:nickel insertion protein [Kocuria palustris]|uniref:nickel insertion protein n=1 Tax=Kocuria palustris TaxID=71999 RepID=UPI003CC839A1
MKRGRPAQTLHALVQVDQVDEQAQRILGFTASLGVRHAPVGAGDPHEVLRGDRDRRAAHRRQGRPR